MGRTAALVVAAQLVVALLLVGACSPGSGDDTASSVSTTVAPPATVRTTTEALTDRVALPVPATSPPPTLSDAAGLDPDELVAAPPPPRFSFVELPEATTEALHDRFLHEDVVEEVLRGVTARGVRLDDRLTGIVLAVAVVPPVAADSEFQRSFQAEATASAEVESEPLQLGEEAMVRFVAGDVHSALWQRENVFVLVSSRNADDLIRTASALVSTVVAPVVVAGDLDGDFIPDPDADADGVPDSTTP